MSMPGFKTRRAAAADWEWIAPAIADIGGVRVVSRGALWDLRDHETWILTASGEPAGLITLRIDAAEAEILAIKALRRGEGAGAALLQIAERRARESGATRLCVSTTNDNTDALRFYQRQGFFVSAYRVGGFREVLELKGLAATTEVAGQHGIPIRDMIELLRDVGLDS